MLESLKEEVCRANRLLPEYRLVSFTWGNVSAVDRARGLVVIKPSGVEYDGMTAEDMVVVDLDGTVVEGRLKPSSDTPTHLELYRNFPEIGGVVHTHSQYAAAWAQAGRGIPCYGTTHADDFYGEIPCTRELTADEIAEDYEKNTGRAIVERFQELDPMAVPGVLSNRHGPFAWGNDAADAVFHAKVLEIAAEMAFECSRLNPDITPLPKAYLDRHYLRKHGKNAYYGQ